MIDHPELHDYPVDLLVYDLRWMLKGGHATAALAYVDELQRRLKLMTELPF